MKLTEKARAEMGWISVKDSLPEHNKEVLVYYLNTPYGTSSVYPIIETGRYIGHWVQLQGEEVTHWMPLPEPPK